MYETFKRINSGKYLIYQIITLTALLPTLLPKNASENTRNEDRKSMQNTVEIHLVVAIVLSKNVETLAGGRCKPSFQLLEL